MKLFILMMVLSVSAMAANKSDEKPTFCKTLDKAVGFVRCETSEIVAYRVGDSTAAYFPKQPTPPAQPKPVEEPKK